MSFLNQARALYHNTNKVGAAITLIEGLKRHPGDAEAFRWLVDLYCDEIRHTGLEEDLVKVFDICPDPQGMYKFVFQRLIRAERNDSLKRLDKARRDAAFARGEIPIDRAVILSPPPSVRSIVLPPSEYGPYDQSYAPGYPSEYPQNVPAPTTPFDPYGQNPNTYPPQPSYDQGYADPYAQSQSPQPTQDQPLYPEEHDRSPQPEDFSHLDLPQEHSPFTSPSPSAPQELDSDWGRSGRTGSLRVQSAAQFLDRLDSPWDGKQKPKNTSKTPPRSSSDHPSDARSSGQSGSHSPFGGSYSVENQPVHPAPHNELSQPDISPFHDSAQSSSQRSSSNLEISPRTSLREDEDNLPLYPLFQDQEPTSHSDAQPNPSDSPEEDNKTDDPWSLFSSSTKSSPSHHREDTDASVDALSPSSDHLEPRPARKKRRQQRESTPKVRKLALRIAVILGVLCVVGFGGYALVQTILAVSSSDTEDHSAESLSKATFLWKDLSDLETQYKKASEDDPQEAEKLAWVQNVRAYIYPSKDDLQADAPLPTQDTFWGKATAVVASLRANNPTEALERFGELPDEESPSTSPIRHWLRGEIALHQGDVGLAQKEHTKAADLKFVPSIVSSIDLCVRKADLDCVDRGLTHLQKERSSHPGVELGEHSITSMRSTLKAPHLPNLFTPLSNPINDSLLDLARRDRRLRSWLLTVPSVWTKSPSLFTSARDKVAHPCADFTHSLLLFRAYQPKEARSFLGRAQSASSDASPRLKTSLDTLSFSGLQYVGRSDQALAALGEYPFADLAALQSRAKSQPEHTLHVAAVLLSLGKSDLLKNVLRVLLAETKTSKEARALAVLYHLDRGDERSVRRHNNRLGSHRTASVASALLDLRDHKTDAARKALGDPLNLSNLPDAYEEPFARALDLRARALYFQEVDQPAELETLARKLQDPSEIPKALSLRIHGRTKHRGDLKILSSLSPTRFSDQVDMAFEAMRASACDEAKVWATRALETYDKNPEAHSVLARCALQNDQPSEAQNHMDQSCPSGDCDRFDLTRPKTLIMKGRHVQAAKELRKRLIQEPRDARAVALLAEALYKAKYLTIGRKEVRDRLKKVRNTKDKNSLAWTYFWLGKLNKSSSGRQKGGEYIEKAHKLLPKNATVLVELGDYYRNSKRGVEALGFYKEASALGTYPKAHVALARMYFARNRNSEKPLIREALERYLQAAPKGKHASWARTRLEKL